MLAPAFISLEELSSSHKKKQVSLKTSQKIKSTGKENKQLKEKTALKTKIPKPTNSYSSASKNKSNAATIKPDNNEKESDTSNKKTTTKTAPDFGKIHRQWNEKFEKGKEAAKKGPTKISAFSMSREANGNSRHTEKQPKIMDDFEIDPASLQNILNGKPMIDFAAPGKLERRTIAVPRSNRMALKPVQTNRSSFHVGTWKSELEAYHSKSVDVSEAATPAAVQANGTSEFAGKNHSKIDQPVPKAVTGKEKEQVSGTKKTSHFVQDVKADFKPDQNSLLSILQGTGESKTPVRGNNPFGPVKRMTFNGVSRTNPYNAAQIQERRGSTYQKEKYENFKKLNFEQRLSVIINSRPGLNGTRGASCFPNAPQGAQDLSQLPSQAATIEGVKDVAKVGTPASTPALRAVASVKENMESVRTQEGRPKPKGVGQLCEINFISPNRETRATQNFKGSLKKSPNYFKSPSKAENPAKDVVAKWTPRKFGKFLTQGPGRLTAEARWNLQHGLPLPPMERRYEFLDLSKAQSVTPKRLPGNSGGFTSSAKSKKCVRWADGQDRRKSDATRQLNFEAEVDNPVTKPLTSTTNPEKENIISRVFRSLQNTESFEGKYSSNAKETTRVTDSHTTPKVSHSVDTSEYKRIPKPFQDVSMISGEQTRLPKDAEKLNTATPGREASDGSEQFIPVQTSNSYTPLPQANPQAGYSLNQSLVNCPMIKRRWARTPHAKEEASRISKDSAASDSVNEQNCTFTTLTEAHLTESASKKANCVDRDDLKHDKSDTVTSDIQWLSMFDVSRGILNVMNDINKWSIQEDIKRACACKENISKTPAARTKKLTDELLLASKPSILSSNRGWLSKGSSSWDASYKQQRDNPVSAPIGSLSATMAPRVSPFDKDEYKDALLSYSSALPGPKKDSGIDRSTSNPAAAKGARISPSTSNSSSTKTSNVDTKRSFSPVSRKGLGQLTSGSRISAIVEEHLRPVRSMIDSAFNVEINQYQQSSADYPVGKHSFSPVLRTPSNHSLEDALSLPSKHIGNGSKGHFDPGHFDLQAGSAFRKISKGSNLSIKPRPYSSYLLGISKAENNINVEYSNIKILDTEVAFHTRFLEVAQRLGGRRIETRDCHDPVFEILSFGDARHFVPVDEP